MDDMSIEITVSDLIVRAGGPAAIVAASEGRIRDPSTVRYWRANGVPARWYALVAKLARVRIVVVHDASERCRQATPWQIAS